jgi:hypothetical protein
MLKMRNIILVSFVFTSFFCFTQNGSYYGNPQDAAKLCAIQLEMASSFATNNDAQLALNKIIKAAGISQNFAIYQCNGTDNCQALTYRGIRYIFFDSYFMKDISNKSNSTWTNISILAHEVGHHINGHTVDYFTVISGQAELLSLSERRQQELEADEFSGYVMFKLGATLSQAQQAINTAGFDGDDTYSTHPNKTKRLTSIEKGYNKAKNPSGSSVSWSNTSNEQAEYYFYLAMNNQMSSNPNLDYIIENYTKSIELNQNLANAYNNRGIAKKNKKLYYEAISDYDKSIDLEPNNPAPYVNKGSVYVFLKDNLRALELFNFALQIDPNFALAYNNRGGVKGAMGDHYGAIIDYNKAISLNPNYAQTYLSRGLSKGALKDYKGAIADHDIVISLEPQNAFAYNMRGLEKMILGLKYCSDFQTACRLGECSLYNQYAGNCR